MRAPGRRSALLAALATVALPALATSPGAGAVAPSSLAVFQASSTGTPLGVVTRVPAETPGGLVLAETEVRLGKSQATAAAATLGPLGDTFLITSQPVPLVSSVPGVVTAQTPPSRSAPARASFDRELAAGPVSGARLTAVTSQAPDAASEATASSFDVGTVRARASSSTSESSVASDGTVSTSTTASARDVTIGPPGGEPVVRIGELVSRARVVVPPGGAPRTELEVGVSRARVAGVPVRFDQDGVRVGDAVPVPASATQQVNAALAALAERGVTVAVVPTTREQGPQGASVSGAALLVRYTVPEGGPRPSDIGTDQAFLLASVSSAATARQRGAPVLPPAAPEAVGASTAAPGPGEPVAPAAQSAGQEGVTAGGAVVSSPSAGGTEAPPAVPSALDAAAAAPPETAFVLPVRASTAAVDRLVASYRVLLLVVVVVLAALHLTRRASRAG